jgi:hypothetical protein
MRPLLSLLAVALLVVPARAEEKIDTAKIEEQARVLCKAYLDADWEKLVAMTHPRVIEIAGGKDKTVDLAKKVANQLKIQGFAFKDFKVGKAETPVVSGKTVYAVVHTSLVLSTFGSTLQSESFLLAISGDAGKTWKFVDGTGLEDPDKRKRFFSDLPTELKLPEPKEPTVIKQ